MTPEEAAKELIEQGLIVRQWVEVLLILDAVKGTAKEDETRRCAARLKSQYDALRAPGLISPSANAASEQLERSRNDILTSGGLEVEP